MLTLYVTRHGETVWNTQKRLQGHKDSELTERGRAQAAWLRDRLAGIRFDAIYASSSQRTINTAGIIRGDRNTDIIKTDLLKEINMGEWEGELDEDIRVKYPEEHSNFWEKPHLYSPLGGESFHDVMDRARAAVRRIMDSHKDGNILLITHGVTAKAIAAELEGKEVKDLWTGPFLKPTSLSIFEHNENGWRTVICGDTSHYR